MIVLQVLRNQNNLTKLKDKRKIMKSKGINRSKSQSRMIAKN